jgi:hypothetical protein
MLERKNTTITQFELNQHFLLFLTWQEGYVHLKPLLILKKPYKFENVEVELDLFNCLENEKTCGKFFDNQTRVFSPL